MPTSRQVGAVLELTMSFSWQKMVLCTSRIHCSIAFRYTAGLLAFSGLVVCKSNRNISEEVQRLSICNFLDCKLHQTGSEIPEDDSGKRVRQRTLTWNQPVRSYSSNILVSVWLLQANLTNPSLSLTITGFIPPIARLQDLWSPVVASKR